MSMEMSEEKVCDGLHLTHEASNKLLSLMVAKVQAYFESLETSF